MGMNLKSLLCFVFGISFVYNLHGQVLPAQFGVYNPSRSGVTNPSTGRIWMDRNLGATKVATSSTDADSYGDLYQWGRRTDGHEKRNSLTTNTLSSTDQPGNAFIVSPNMPSDWRSPQNTNLWQGLIGTNNPCPSGYRIPTEAEWDTERLSWGTQNATGAFNSPLKLPRAGYRSRDGLITSVSSLGLYWSSTVSSDYSWNLSFGDSHARMDTNPRAGGYSVRCIKD